jgi:hypothetical protein
VKYPNTSKIKGKKKKRKSKTSTRNGKLSLKRNYFDLDWWSDVMFFVTLDSPSKKYQKKKQNKKNIFRSDKVRQFL